MSGLYFDFVTSWVSLSLALVFESKEQVIKHALECLLSESNQGYHSINHLMKQQKELQQPTLYSALFSWWFQSIQDSSISLVKQHFMRFKGTMITLSSPTWSANISSIYWLQSGGKQKADTWEHLWLYFYPSPGQVILAARKICDHKP